MAVREWQFATKPEALKKLEALKNPETYQIVQNRLGNRFAKGWTLKKLK